MFPARLKCKLTAVGLRHEGRPDDGQTPGGGRPQAASHKRTFMNKEVKGNPH